MAERTDHARPPASPNPVRVRFDRFELDEANARGDILAITMIKTAALAVVITFFYLTGIY